MALHALTNADGGRKQDGEDNEERLDQMIEDSFPASDPPSTTPLTSIGGREQPSRDDGPGGVAKAVNALKRIPPQLAIAAVGGIIAASAVVIAIQRARRPKRHGLLARAAPLAKAMPALSSAIPEAERFVHTLPPRGRRGWRRLRQAA